jgi:hypothetical protein
MRLSLTTTPALIAMNAGVSLLPLQEERRVAVVRADRHDTPVKSGNQYSTICLAGSKNGRQVYRKQ